MAARIEITGTATIAKTLRKAGIDLKELKPVNLDVAQLVMRRAHLNAPVLTGKLRSTLRASGTNRAGVIRAGNNRATGVPYAGVVHWGWGRRGIPANPFIAKAAKQTEPQWTGIYAVVVDKALRQVKGK